MRVEEFRKKVFEAVQIEPKKQRLLFRGKQMENKCDLLDYRIEMGTIIDVTERVVLADVDNNKEEEEPPKFSGEREPGNYLLFKNNGWGQFRRRLIRLTIENCFVVTIM